MPAAEALRSWGPGSNLSSAKAPQLLLVPPQPARFTRSRPCAGYTPPGTSPSRPAGTKSASLTRKPVGLAGLVPLAPALPAGVLAVGNERSDEVPRTAPTNIYDTKRGQNSQYGKPLQYMPSAAQARCKSFTGKILHCTRSAPRAGCSAASGARSLPLSPLPPVAGGSGPAALPLAVEACAGRCAVRASPPLAPARAGLGDGAGRPRPALPRAGSHT